MGRESEVGKGRTRKGKPGEGNRQRRGGKKVTKGRATKREEEEKMEEKN